MDIKSQYEQLERQILSPYAAKSGDSRGRERSITACSIRTDFQRDRDRIIHCKSFRRMKHKTQVFLLPDGDHYRTRLTHTLEVSQIARTIARALQLNEDLTEAISLGHDLGHTPFGHVGESVLDEMLLGGFAHNEQSLRVVELLENNGAGLNLTFEVRDGIVHHKKDGEASTLEGRIVSYADRIAYLNHDIDDAIRAGVLTESRLPTASIALLGDTHGRRIDRMIHDIVENSAGKNTIHMSAECERAMHELREFMFDQVYTDPVAKQEEGKARHVVAALYKYYLGHVALLPDEFIARVYCDGVERAVADYVSCMTDRYAISQYEQLYVPKGWHL